MLNGWLTQPFQQQTTIESCRDVCLGFCLASVCLSQISYWFIAHVNDLLQYCYTLFVLGKGALITSCITLLVLGGARCSSMVRAFAHGVMVRWIDPSLSYFSFQPVLHDWCNKGSGVCFPVYGIVHIKEPLLLNEKCSPCGGSRFPLSLSEWSSTICLMPYNRK